MDVAKVIKLKPEEEVILLVRPFLLPLWPKWLLAFLWVVLPFFLLFPLFKLQIIGVIIFFVLLFTGLVYLLRTFFMWHRSLFILTDRRIIDHDQQGLFGRVISEAPYYAIQDVSYVMQGFLPTVFRYGDVIVQIKGNAVNFEIFRVFRPAMIHDLINDLREEHGSDSNNIRP